MEGQKRVKQICTESRWPSESLCGVSSRPQEPKPQPEIVSTDPVEPEKSSS